MPLQNCGQWNEHCPHLSGILSATFDHYRWLLRPAFNLHVYLPFLRTAAIVNGYMPLSKWILSPSFGVVSVTFDHYHWLLRLASIFIGTYTITWNARYRQLVNTIMLMNALAILRGYFQKFSTTIIDYFALRQSSKTLTITSNARYRQLLNIVILMSTLAILRGTFGNCLPLSLSTSACVNLHRDLYHYFERALSPTCEHYNVNEHTRNPSGYFR